MRQERKKDMRREMKLIMANLDKRWESVAHVEICSHLSRLIADKVFGPAEHILAWVPCFPGEVDLSSFIANMLRTKKVYLPRIGVPGTMSFRNITEEWSSHLERSANGILQPLEGYGERFDAETAENVVVIAPGLAFDRHGRRIGRGGGYYDRFLEDAALAGAVRVGVCWSMQIVPEIPTDPHDIPMDWICHERGVVQVS